jgi:hypothetical protein
MLAPNSFNKVSYLSFFSDPSISIGCILIEVLGIEETNEERLQHSQASKQFN